MIEGIDSKVPARLRDAYDFFVSSLKDDNQKMNQAVADASKDQDDPDSSSTQSS